MWVSVFHLLQNADWVLQNWRKNWQNQNHSRDWGPPFSTLYTFSSGYDLQDVLITLIINPKSHKTIKCTFLKHTKDEYPA